jgi:arabinofuranan 3-O-arabinosyltransferase
VTIEAPVADLLAGDAVDAALCGTTALDLDAGTHRLTTTSNGTGLQVDRIVLSEPSRAAPGDTSPTATVTESGRLSRQVTVDRCAEGCWLVLGEGFHESWSASIDGRDLGPPQLVDGGFNGWRIDPTDEPVAVSIEWTAQTPVTVALLLTVISVLACIVIAVLDRRRDAVAVVDPPRFAMGEPVAPARMRWIAAAVWVVAAMLIVGPGWGLVAAVAAGVLVVIAGRPRLAGAVTMAIVGLIGVVMVRVVQTERPWPDAGWPSRFEWLHGLGMFAAVSLAVTLLTPRPATPEGFDGGAERAAGEDGEERRERQVEAGVPPQEERHDDQRGHADQHEEHLRS